MRAELRAVANSEFDLVIGTQLVAKGHNFPHLTLVGVVDADIGLANGDPRAAERTFQLLNQVAGRAGRGEKPGRAFLQTFQPDHPVLRALLSGDFERFYREETEVRRDARPAAFRAAVPRSWFPGPIAPPPKSHARALARAAHRRGKPSAQGPAAQIAVSRAGRGADRRGARQEAVSACWRGRRAPPICKLSCATFWRAPPGRRAACGSRWTSILRIFFEKPPRNAPPIVF